MDNEKKKRLAELRDSMKSYGYMDGVEELEDIFPEIKENEDEGIRKFIIDCIDELRKANAENADFNGCCSEAIAYLEKHTESTWTAEDESFVKHILPRILNPDKWTLDQRTADKKYLTEFIERQKRKYAKEQKPAEGSEEDEWIRKHIIKILENLAPCHWDGNEKARCIAYLERQKEQKPAERNEKNEMEPMEIKYAEKIYKVYGTKELPGGIVGYIIEDEPGHYDCIIHPDEVLGGGYGIKSCGTPYPTKDITFDKQPTEWSEEEKERIRQSGRLDVCYNPEKYGLCHKTEWGEGEMNVLDSIIDDYENAAKSFCGYDGKIMFLKALRDGEYGLSKQEWSEEDIKKIRLEEYTKGFNDAAFGGKLKEWSEEDEKMLQRIIRYTESEYQDWCNDKYGNSEIVSDGKQSCLERLDWLKNRLKSLRLQPKQEWDEEDNIIKNVVSYLNGEYGFNTHYDEDAYRRGLVRQLKSLQSHWKPSEEQMRAVFDASERNDKLGSVLRNLYDDLKKL